MTPPNCDAVVDLIDLYAAGECSPGERNLVRAHLDRCDVCREALAHSREMMGLLAIHFKQDEALARLGERLRAEARPERREARHLPFVRRFAAVAALLLIAFGLGVWLTPSGAPVPAPVTLQLALATRQVPEHFGPKRAKDAPGPMRELSVTKPAAIEAAKKTRQWPRPQSIDLDLVLTNPGPKPVRLELGGPDFRCELELSGPRVVRQVIDRPEFVPFPPRSVTVPPGRSLTVTVERLASQVGDRVEYLYPTERGEYTLGVRLAARREAGGMVRLTAGPVALRLR